MMNIVETLESPKFFGPAFPHQETWRSWKVMLKAMYGIEMSIEELKIFQGATARQTPNPNGYFENFGIIGRRGGKSRIASLCAVWEAVFGGWSEKLSKGELGWEMILATDKNQGKIILNYVKALLELVPGVVSRLTEETVYLKNNIAITVKPATFRASRGYSTVFICLDELAYFRDENSANPAVEIIVSLLPGLMQGGKLLGISTPYGRMGYLYSAYKDFYGKEDPDCMVWKKSTVEMNPTYSQGIIDRLLKRDKVLFTSEYMAEFRSDIENFLSEETIRAAQTHSQLPPDPKVQRYFSGIDPSGGRSDSMTMAIAHRTLEGKVIVARTEERKAPFNPDDVCREFAEILKAYRVHEATADRYAGVWPTANFQKYGIAIKMSEMDKSQIYLEVQPLFAMGKIEIPNDERILIQFQNLERKIRTGGHDAVDHAPGMKDDVCNAISLAACLANQRAVWSPEKRESMMPVHSEPSWKGRFRDPMENTAKTREELEAEMRKSMGRVGVPDRSKPNPWNNRGPGNENF
jgi:hypothetical protein